MVGTWNDRLMTSNRPAVTSAAGSSLTEDPPMTEPNDKKKRKPRRRAGGEGSIVQRPNGSWAATINLGTDVNGKRVRKWVYGKTQKDVVDELTRLRSQKQDGTLKPATKHTVAEFMQQWLDTSASLRVRRTTLINYRQHVKLYIAPVVGSLKLEKLSPINVMSIYAKMAEKGLSSRTQQLTHTILRRALKMAVKWRLIVQNVCDAVDRPSAQRHEATFLDVADAGKLFTAVKGDRLEALYVLAITTGLRQGELFGLEWQDIDFAGNTLSVRRALKTVKGESYTEEPKTARSRRQVALPAIAIEALHDHRRRMMTEGRAGDARIFSLADGNPLTCDFVRRQSMLPILKSAGLPVIRFHDLRHTSASLLFAAGEHPKVVQERLGHSSIQITLDTYSHAIPSMQTEAAKKMDAMFPTRKQA